MFPVIFYLLFQAILLSIYGTTTALLLLAYQKKQRALQWWSAKQSLKLFLESDKIRDGMLQDSFIIRRSLELLPADDRELSKLQLQAIQDSLKAIESFHRSLVALSDRLFPAYLQESFPLAMQAILKPWLTSHPQVNFQIDIPNHWRQETADYSLVVLRSLEELLKISLQEVEQQASVRITLKQEEKLGKLLVEITYLENASIIYNSIIKELQYLCESFKFLTSGKCFIHIRHRSISWQFWWFN